MIEKKNLLEITKLNNLKPWQQEKHYIQSLILTVLSEQPVVFKGGTYLWFFHGLQRFSEDLDFTASEKLAESFPENVSQSLELFGVENESKTITNNETTLSFRITAKGPLNIGEKDLCRVYVEISKREHVLEKTLSLKLDFPAYNLPTKRLQGMSLTEVCAEKVRAVLTREKARDVFDLHYLIKSKKTKFDKELIEKKLAYYGKAFSKKEFLQKTRKTQECYIKELQNIILEELPKFASIQKTIREWVKE